MVTAEEHNDVEGLGSAVAKVLVENVHIPMQKVGIPDVFGQSGGSDELMERYGLTIESIIAAANEVLERRGTKRRPVWGKFIVERKHRNRRNAKRKR